MTAPDEDTSVTWTSPNTVTTPSDYGGVTTVTTPSDYDGSTTDSATPSTGTYTGPSSTEPGPTPSCVTGTSQDLIGWVDVRDPSGGPCSPCRGDAVYQAVLANPCDYDIDLDLSCAPNSGGWVELWGWHDADPYGRAGSLSYGCLGGATTLTVSAHSFLLDTFEWSPALDPGDYTGYAELIDGRRFPSAPFTVQ